MAKLESIKEKTLEDILGNRKFSKFSCCSTESPIVDQFVAEYISKTLRIPQKEFVKREGLQLVEENRYYKEDGKVHVVAYFQYPKTNDLIKKEYCCEVGHYPFRSLDNLIEIKQKNGRCVFNIEQINYCLLNELNIGIPITCYFLIKRTL